MTTTDVAAPPEALDLLLLRLLPATRKPPVAGIVRKTLDAVLAARLSSEEFDDLVRQARSDGLLAQGLRLTDAGRARALAILGLDAAPPRLQWRTIQSRYLTPLALGLPVPAPGEKSLTGDQVKVQAMARRLGLSVRRTATVQNLMTALVGKDLGFPDETDWKRMLRRALSRRLNAGEVLTTKEIQKQFPRVTLDLPPTRKNPLPARLIRDYLARRPADPVPAETTFDLAAFAATVRTAARHCPTGRYGENKVFISHLHRYLRDEPSFPPLELDMFKSRLAEANAAGLIELARADLVQDMDPADVRDSEIRRLTGLFHFVTINQE
jgi:hypothetical protein